MWINFLSLRYRVGFRLASSQVPFWINRVWMRCARLRVRFLTEEIVFRLRVDFKPEFLCSGWVQHDLWTNRFWTWDKEKNKSSRFPVKFYYLALYRILNRTRLALKKVRSTRCWSDSLTFNLLHTKACLHPITASTKKLTHLFRVEFW